MPKTCCGECKPNLSGVIVLVLSILQIAAFICDFETLTTNNVDWRAFGGVQLGFALLGFLVTVITSLCLSCGRDARGFRTLAGTLMWREALNSSVMSIFQASFILAIYTNDETHRCEGSIFPVTIMCALFAFSNVTYLIFGPIVQETPGT